LLGALRNNNRSARRIGDATEPSRESLDQELRARPCSTVLCNEAN